MINATNTERQVAENILALIAARGSTKQHVADAAHMSRYTLNRTLKGGRSFTIPELFAVAQALGTTPSELMPEQWGKQVAA